MAEATGTASLVIRQGARRGRRLKIEVASFKIGQHDDCDLVLKDSYVSPIHAVLEQSGANWVVRNQGVRGTLVNGEAIAGTHALAPGDMIQVGAETLLEFALTSPSKRQAPDTADPAAGRPWWQHPAALAGIGVYLAGIVGFFVFLATVDATRDRGLAFESVGTATEATRDFFVSGRVVENGTSSPVLDPDADPSHDFYALIQLREDGQEAEVLRVADEILARVEGDFFQAWQYEERGAYGLAIDRYQRVIDTVPTLRAPVTRLASSRIRALRGKGRE